MTSGVVSPSWLRPVYSGQSQQKNSCAALDAHLSPGVRAASTRSSGSGKCARVKRASAVRRRVKRKGLIENVLFYL